MKYYLSFSWYDRDLNYGQFKKLCLGFLTALNSSYEEFRRLYFVKSENEVLLQDIQFQQQFYENVNDLETAYINDDKNNKDLFENSKSPFGFNISFATKRGKDGLGIIVLLFGGMTKGYGGGKIEFITPVTEDVLFETYGKLMLTVIEYFKPDYAYITSNTIQKELKIKGSKLTTGIHSYFKTAVSLSNDLLSDFSYKPVLGNDSLIRFKQELQADITKLKALQNFILVHLNE